MKANNNPQAKQNNILLMTISFFISIAFAICVAILVFQEISAHQSEVLSSFGSQQLLLVKSVAQSSATNHNQSVTETLTQAETNGSRFWILADDTSILFFKNQKDSVAYQNKTIQDLVKDYSIQGGYQSRKLYSAIENKQDCSLSYSESASGKKMLISLHFFSSGGKDYVIGMSTAEKYIFTNVNLVHHNVYMLLFCGIPLIVLIAIILFFTLKTIHINKKMSEYEKLLRDKNMTIETLSNSVSNYEHKQSKPNVYDDLTGVLYNLDFLQAFLNKATNPTLFPLSVVIIHIGNRSYCEDHILFRAANTIRTNVAKKDLVARDGQDFIIAFPQRNQDELLQQLKILHTKLETKFPKQPIRVGVAYKNTVDFNVQHMISQAYENLQEEPQSIEIN